jgi:hypothetical protein
MNVDDGEKASLGGRIYLPVRAISRHNAILHEAVGPGVLVLRLEVPLGTEEVPASVHSGAKTYFTETDN